MDWNMILLDLWIKAWPLLLAIGIDLLIGVLTALKNRVFQWDKLSGFLESYGTKLVGWLALEAMTFLPAKTVDQSGAVGVGISALAWTAYIGIFGYSLVSILDNLTSLGVIPKSIRNITTKLGFGEKGVG